MEADDGPTLNADLIFKGRPLIQRMNFKQNFDHFHPFLKVCHHNYFSDISANTLDKMHFKIGKVILD